MINDSKQLKTYTIKEMYAMYGVSAKTWRQWMKPWLKQLQRLGHRPRMRIYTVRQVEFIWDKLGRP